MMLFFFMGMALIEKYKPKYGHETTYTVALGLLISVLVYAIKGPELVLIWKFSDDLFFDWFLPPIIMNSGFNMYKQQFFRNLGNVTIFGVFVTFVCFGLYSALSIMLLNLEPTMTNYYAQNHPGEAIPGHEVIPAEESTQIIKLTAMQILLFTSLMCSSDVVAAVSIVDYTKQPKLYSCIFGEGCVNDIVSIILFNTVVQLQTVTFEWYTIFEVLGKFLILGVVSLSVGLIMGLVTSFVFKHAPYLKVNAVIEAFLMIAFSLASYFISSSIKIAGLEMSGIISLLTCGIVQSHYTYYNMSPQGKTCSCLVVSFLGTMCEAAVYSYVGIALYSQIPSWWSWSFIGAQTLIIIVGRFAAVVGTFYLFTCCFRKKTIAFRELLFIVYAGMIRGAIAFALVLRIPVCESEGDEGCIDEIYYEVLVSTTLILVVVTTFMFGSFMGKVQSVLVPGTAEDEEEYHDMKRKNSAMIESEMGKRRASSLFQEHHEEIEHPNEQKNADSFASDPGEDEPFSWPKSRFVRWFLHTDETVFKPFFIRKYNRMKQLLEDEYQQLLKVKVDDEEDEQEIMVDKVEAMQAATSRNQRAMSQLRERTASQMGGKSFSGRIPSFNNPNSGQLP
jgi:NhaP-type Na+/H+ or K+/H+ antiporter